MVRAESSEAETQLLPNEALKRSVDVTQHKHIFAGSMRRARAHTHPGSQHKSSAMQSSQVWDRVLNHTQSACHQAVLGASTCLCVCGMAGPGVGACSAARGQAVAPGQGARDSGHGPGHVPQAQAVQDLHRAGAAAGQHRALPQVGAWPLPSVDKVGACNIGRVRGGVEAILQGLEGTGPKGGGKSKNAGILMRTWAWMHAQLCMCRIA